VGDRIYGRSRKGGKGNSWSTPIKEGKSFEMYRGAENPIGLQLLLKLSVNGDYSTLPNLRQNCADHAGN
jgi:hypothetical protein